MARVVRRTLAAGPPNDEFDFPMFTDPPSTGNGYEKEAVRNVRNGEVSDGANAASEGESYEATPSGEESADDRFEGSVAPPVDPRQAARGFDRSELCDRATVHGHDDPIPAAGTPHHGSHLVAELTDADVIRGVFHGPSVPGP